MTLRLVIAPEAADQIARALEWWRQNRDKAPELLDEEIDQALDLVLAQPEAGSASRGLRISGLRRVLLRRCRYHLYYTVDAAEGRLDVVGFWHAERRSPMR